MVDCGSPTSGCRGASQRGIHHGDALDERVARGDIHHGTGECGDADVVDGRDVVWRADGVVDGCRGDATAAGCELEHKHASGSRRDVRESPQDRGRVLGHHDSVDRVVHDRRYSQPVPGVTIQRNPVRGVDINSAREACEISAAGKREQRGPVSRIGQFAREEERRSPGGIEDVRRSSRMATPPYRTPSPLPLVHNRGSARAVEDECSRKSRRARDQPRTCLASSTVCGEHHHGQTGWALK